LPLPRGNRYTLSTSAFAARDFDEPDVYKKKGLQTIPMGRTGEPEEMAKTALLLVSDAASYTTGALMHYINACRYVFENNYFKEK